MAFLIIAGHPATGKTTLVEKLKKFYPDHTILHTDDYMEFGYKESLYKLKDDILVRLSGGEKKIIVEGVMGARLMRKLQEEGFEDYVDLYLYISANLDTITDVYTRERPDKAISQIVSTCKGLDTVNQSIDKSKLPHLEVHINGSAHDIIHTAICQHLELE